MASHSANRTNAGKVTLALEERIFIASFAVDTSIAKLGERGTLVEGDMVRLAALDLVLRIVCARMVGIAFDLELADTHTDDRAADAPRLGVPAHAIMDLEGLRHGRSIRCRKKNCQEAILALNAYLFVRLHVQPMHSPSVP